MLDNSSTDKTPQIQRCSSATHASRLHFTPTYSSWLNLVERWFAELTTKWIKRGAHRSVRDLIASIRTWITNWNDDLKRCIWHKPQTRSSTSFAAYCPNEPRSLLPDSRRAHRFSAAASGSGGCNGCREVDAPMTHEHAGDDQS